jgi:hypothetical protein
MSRSSLVILFFAVAFAVAVIRSARKLRTPERHTFAWLLVSIVTAALAIWRQSIDAIAAAMGIYYPPAALFFCVCGGLLWLVYRLSLQVGEQRQRIERLAQEVAILSASRTGQPPSEAAPASAPPAS